MDGLKPGRGSYSNRPHARPSSKPAQAKASSKERHSGEKYWLVRSIGKVASKQKATLWNKFKQTEFAKWPDKALWRRIYAGTTLVLFVFSTIAGIVQPFINDKFYGVTQATRAVLPEPKESLGVLLTENEKEAKFVYNDGYTGATGDLAKNSQGEPRITASFPKEASKGMTVSDPVNKIDFKMTPKFKLNSGKQDRNQLFYPLTGQPGYLVLTAQTASVKEDIVLETATDDRQVFKYELDLGDSMDAKLEKNGSVGIYGSSLPINGNVATGSEKDAELLQQARMNAAKDKLLFVIPKPVVVESGRDKGETVVQSWFELEGTSLKLVSENLKKANYPLSIDPSVYVESAAQLMRGNNETNVEFDIATEQFKKGTTTGARIDSWTETTSMSGSAWDQGVAAANGYVYKAGGKTSRVMPTIADKKVTTSSTSVNPLVVNMPDYRPTGDLYIALIGVSGTTFTTPTGWTAFSTTSVSKLGAYYRYSNSAEPASYSFTTSTTQQFSAVVLRITNVDSSNPVNVSSTGVNNQIGSASMTYPSLTTSAQGTLVIAADGFQSDPVKTNGYSPAGWADVISVHSNNVAGDSTAGGIMVSNLDSPPLSGVATGTQTMTAAQTGHANGNFTSTAIAINGVAATTAFSSAVEWARFNSTNGALDSPAPGSNEVACSGWCTNSNYNLPTASPSSSNGAGLVGSSMVAYNGYLYSIGGYDGTYVKNTVYISKLGAKGEPSLWHPSNPDQSTWGYWHKDTGFGGGNERMYHAAYAYNGKMYVVGGRTSTSGAAPGALNATLVADILPNGTLGSWSSGPTLASGRYGLAVQAYNGYLYAIGGNNGSTIYSNVYYTRINTDGSLNAWQSAATGQSTGGTLKQARTAQGGVMAGIWGGYLYVAGGCSAVNTTNFGNCSAISSSVELASINADGSLDDWNTILNLRNQRFGYTFVAWQDSLYRFGGCSRQDTTSGECYGSHKTVQYGNINQDGDASTVSITTASGSGNCIDPDPYDCNLPNGGTGAGQGGQALSAAVILNGYMYVIGGCTTSACTTMSGNTSYTAIDSNGQLKSPPSCEGTVSGAWCVDSTNTISGGIGAAGTAVFNGTVYLVGGKTGAANKNTILRNTVNADGSLAGAWDSQGLTGVGGANVSYTFTYARANPAGIGGGNPGNLYIFGGCTSGASGAGCNGGNNYTPNVYKCNIQTAGTISGCTTTGQESIGTVTGAINPGLGIHAGAVYANYVYLIGGVADGNQDLTEVRYTKFDNSNNVVGIGGAGTGWTVSDVEMNNGRRRGTAFGYNGHLYAVGGFEATLNQPLDTIEYAKINVSDGSLISTIPKPGFPGKYLFKKSAVTINQRWGLALAVSNSFAYVIGGCKEGASPACTTLDNTIQTFQVYNNDSGAPGGYATSANTFATDRIGAGSAVLNGYMYIAGGCTTNTDCSTVTNDVQKSLIGADGSLGAWSSAGSSGLASLGYGQLEVAGGSLYFVGGQNSGGTAQATVHYATMGSGGNVTSWTTTTTGLPAARTQFSSAVWNNRLYVTGGLNSGTAQTTVYISPQLNGGDITGSWTTSTGFNVARAGHVAIAYANNLYILGGYTGSNYLSDVQYAKLDSTNGTISGSWIYSTSLPVSVRQADGYAVNGYMYIFGGRSSTNDCSPRTLVAPISANTTIASGNNPTGIGEWYETNRKFDGGRYGVTATYSQGKAYVLGGGCQGVVMQDDFDSSLDAAEWTSTTGMTVGTTCQSTSTSNVLYTTSGGTPTPSAVTKDVNVASGGTVYFKLFAPDADGGGCFTREANLLGGSADNVILQYSINAGGAWTQIASYNYNQDYDPFVRVAVTIPAGAQTASTRFRWYMPAGEANDSFSLEDISIVANGNTTVTYAPGRVSQTALLSQPQVASYSRLIDAGKDVFPTNFLMNGLDNSIGARWQMSYRSMNDPTVTDANKACGGSAMTAFSSLTSFGDVTLGKPERYYSKNGAGTDIGCARYYFINISIDASQTYGYPDDIARGPTLDNFLIFFQSNPGQRLLHGKTFLEGSQQPLDTPCRQSGGSNNANCTLQ